MTRNQKLAIQLTALLEDGMICEVEYYSLEDFVRFWCELKTEKYCVDIIKEDFTDEQAEYEYRKCISIIKKMKRNLLFRNPSLIFDKKKMTRNQKLAIKLMNKVEKGMDIKIIYENQNDRIDFTAYTCSVDWKSEFIEKHDTDERAERRYKRFLSTINYI